MRGLGAVACVLVVFLAAGCGAGTVSRVTSQITYGTPDDDGHPFVGALVAEWRQAGKKDILCSGTLISQNVFLTAAHCTAFLESRGITQVWVTFVSRYDETTPESALQSGTMHTNPNYTFRQDDPGDIAVVVLDAPVGGIAPAALPAAGLLDLLNDKNGLRGKKFTAVGYGVQEPQLGGGPPTFPFSGERRRSVSEFRSLQPAWLTLSQNAHTGDGGTCYGDSGGPNFLGAGADETNIVAAITVTGDAMCLATNKTHRVDTPAARAFLANFVTLP
ncbi:MAG: trypsin-like serine protease [Armatimonadota bacterium]|nr:trypsin-like serine protease [Armatimonadota bacterium]MDR5696619.1 trypsin-like serine protease [Armatimonadota bacterium]